VVILRRSLRPTEILVTQIKEAAVSIGLEIRESKIKYMKINTNLTNLEKIC